MKAERARILDMLHQGAISVEQAEQLLDALETSYQKEATTPPVSQASPSPEASSGMVGGLGGSIASTVANALRGVFGGLGGGSGRTNFSEARLTKASLERMALGTSYTNFGTLTIADDVPPELLSQKIGGFTNFGSVMGPQHLLSILESCTDSNFGHFGASDEEESEGEAGLVNQGKTILTKEQLERMPDNSRFVNQGKVVISPDVPTELLSQKISTYVNQGKTIGPAALLGVLQAHCPQNQGKFVLDEMESQEE